MNIEIDVVTTLSNGEEIHYSFLPQGNKTIKYLGYTGRDIKDEQQADDTLKKVVEFLYKNMNLKVNL